MILGPCTIDSIENHCASFQVDRVFVAGRPTEWWVRLALPECWPDEAFAPELQSALDAVELRVARRRETHGGTV